MELQYGLTVQYIFPVSIFEWSVDINSRGDCVVQKNIQSVAEQRSVLRQGLHSFNSHSETGATLLDSDQGQELSELID